MRRSFPGPIFLLALTLSLVGQDALHAQQLPDAAQPTPRLLSVMPPGGQLGTTVEITLNGTDLEDPEKLLFSQAGITAEPVPTPEPPKPAPGKPAQPKQRVTKFKVTIPANTPVGIHQLRLVNAWGVSNSRAFVVGDLKEVLEKEPNNDVPEAQRIDLNSTVNGVIAAPTDVDYFVFSAKKGQRVLISCLAASIDSRLHPAIEVYNSKGKLVAFNRDYDHTDALCDLAVAEDGDYQVRLFEFTHTRGNAEHFYRLSVTTGPWIDAVFPCCVEAGKATEVTVYGRNLPGGKLAPETPSDEVPLEMVKVTVTLPATGVARYFHGYLPPTAAMLDGFEYRIKSEVGWSNPFLLTLAQAPLIVANQADKGADASQTVTLPCEIAGQIDKERKSDWFAFTAKKGDVFHLELFSERLGAPAYMYFVLRNAKNKQPIMESADNQDMLNLKFFTRSEDPQPYVFTVPEDGTYQLKISSRTAERVFGPRQYYRMRLAPAQPDFQLVVMSPANHRPDGTSLGKGGTQKLDVFVWRRDGFKGEIALNAEGLPAGVTCVPQTLSSTVRQGALVLTATEDAAAWTGNIQIKGTATIQGKKVEHTARAGTIVWPVPPQQNIPTLSRLDEQVYLAVRDKPAFTLTTNLEKPSLTQGDGTQLTFKVNRNSADLKNPLAVQINPTELPQGFTVNNNQPFSLTPDKSEGKLPVKVAPNVPPGAYTIVLHASTPIPFAKQMKGNKQPLNFVEFSTPATLTVLPKSLATLALPSPTATVKPGAQAVFVVKLNRQFDFEGEFKIEVTVPAAIKDVTIAPVTVSGNASEAKLTIAVAADAKPGNRPDLVLKATALYKDTPIVQEVKFNVNVVK